MQRFIVANDIGAATTSMASIKLSSGESIDTKSQQVRPLRSSLSHTSANRNACTITRPNNFQIANGPLAMPSVSIFDNFHDNNPFDGSHNDYSKPLSLHTIQETNSPLRQSSQATSAITVPHNDSMANGNVMSSPDYFMQYSAKQCSMLDFSISSVGRSFIDETEGDTITDAEDHNACESLHTPETPTPNISPTSSQRLSEAFSNDFVRISSPISETTARPFIPVGSRDKTSSGGGSWDLLELDLNFHEVNFDPSFGGDVEERVFFGDDPLGILPYKPTQPDSHDL